MRPPVGVTPLLLLLSGGEVMVLPPAIQVRAAWSLTK